MTTLPLWPDALSLHGEQLVAREKDGKRNSKFLILGRRFDILIQGRENRSWQ